MTSFSEFVLMAVAVLTVASLGQAADESWDPHVMFIKSVKECKEKFPDLEIGKLREYILKQDSKIKCFLDCLIRANGVLDESNRVKATEAGRWVEAASDGLRVIGVDVSADMWKDNTKQCADEEYADGDDKCSGAVRVFQCYAKGIPL
ncbi:hypothetical protein R5R35_009016 [Gryllus longicercus]